jgi:alkylglycerol monooxygenase
VWLENRPAARGLELLRLALNLPLLFWLERAQLLPLAGAGWSLVGVYSLASLFAWWRIQPQLGAKVAG